MYTDSAALAGHMALVYGLEGLGFESLRARPGQMPYPLRGRAYSMPVGASVGSHGRSVTAALIEPSLGVRHARQPRRP